MNDDELRDRIWNQLFRAAAAKTVDEIALLANCDVPTVAAAVQHEWFQITDNGVSIAYAGSGSRHSSFVEPIGHN